MAERASIMAPTMVVVTGVLMARGEATLPGTMAPDTPEDGAEAPLHGMMDRGISAVTAVARLRGAVAPAARRDGEAARPRGAAAPAPTTGLSVARAHGEGNEIASNRGIRAGGESIAPRRQKPRHESTLKPLTDA
jgi:hypothetical protein